MERIYSVEIDRYTPLALVRALEMLCEGIPDFEYEWRLTANGGGIDYGLFLNIDISEKVIEICNQPEYGTDGDDDLEDILDAINEEEEEEEE